MYYFLLIFGSLFHERARECSENLANWEEYSIEDQEDIFQTISVSSATCIGMVGILKRQISLDGQ